MVYVCELPEVRGRFDPAKAISLGIRPGRKYSDLQNGKSVPRDDNTAVVSNLLKPLITLVLPVFWLDDGHIFLHPASLTSAF